MTAMAVTIQEAADLLSVSPKTVRNMGLPGGSLHPLIETSAGRAKRVSLARLAVLFGCSVEECSQAHQRFADSACCSDGPSPRGRNAPTGAGPQLVSRRAAGAASRRVLSDLETTPPPAQSAQRGGSTSPCSDPDAEARQAKVFAGDLRQVCPQGEARRPDEEGAPAQRRSSAGAGGYSDHEGQSDA